MPIRQLWASIVNVFGRRSRSLSAAAQTLCEMAHETFVDMAGRQNETIDSDSLRISVSKPSSAGLNGRSDQKDFWRFFVANSFWAISMRAAGNTVEFFIVPAIQLSLLSQIETASRLKLKLRAESAGRDVRYFLDEVAVPPSEVRTLLASLLKDILSRSKSDFDFMPESMRVQFGDQSLTAAVRELIREKGALTDRIADQQEKLQTFIATEIHDTVVSDLLFLLRKIENDLPLEKSESSKILEGAVDKLRDLCTDLVPRNLGDWGLAVLLEDLFNKVCARSALEGTFNCKQSLPSLPEDIELQVFRVVQECLNNVEKHGNASRAGLDLGFVDGELTVVISDDGVGFDQSLADNHKGSGHSIMLERVDLIRLRVPAALQIESQPEAGTRVTLRVRVAAAGDSELATAN